MLDIGWTELLLIGIVALIVVGPKDLPGMFRTLGRFTGKMKGMAREFQRAMNDAADEAGVKDVASDLKKATSARSMGLDKLGDAASKFEKWEPGKSTAPKGPETQKLSEERAATARKIQDYSAAKATEKRAAEAAPAKVADKPPAKPKAAPKPRAAAETESRREAEDRGQAERQAGRQAGAQAKAKPAKAGDGSA